MEPGNIVEKSSYAMILTGFATIISLLFIKAPYGRYSTDKGWGFLVPAKLAWVLMESPNLWISLVTFTLNQSNNNLSIQPNRILMMCFILHYVNRAIVFPLSMKASNPMPVSVMLMAMFYCTWNGFNQATQLLLVKAYPDEWLYDPRFIVGVFLFVWGFWVNIQSDHILVNLRKGSEANGEKKYVIPRGGWFEYVSCANYCKSEYFTIYLANYILLYSSRRDCRVVWVCSCLLVASCSGLCLLYLLQSGSSCHQG